MHFTDRAIVLSARRHAESSGIVRVLTQAHGLCAGIVRGIASRTNRGVYQTGNLLLVTWKARVSEQLGAFHAELLEPAAALIMQDAAKLSALTSAAALTERLLPEREPHATLFDAMLLLTDALEHDDQWPEAYARFELELLASCGFRLDLARCAATGVTEDLIYVSPRTGRAVSRAAGEPYKDRLLLLPGFLISPRVGGDPLPLDSRLRGNILEILASLRLTGYFLEQWLLHPHGWTLPAARQRLVDALVSMKTQTV